MNSSEYLGRIKSVLAVGAYDGLTYSDELITEGLRQAVREYDGASVPVSGVLPVQRAGRDQEITGLTNCLELLLVAYPYTSGADWRPNVVGWHVMAPGWIELETAGAPQIGEKLLCYFRRYHTINGLDDETETTVPKEHQSLMVLGAAGWASQLHYRQAVEAVKGPTPEQMKRLESWGRLRLEEYREGLAAVMRSGMMPQPCWGNVGL